MQLTGKSAIDQAAVAGYDAAHVRPASYDLSVGGLFTEGRVLPSPAVIRPQQIVVIVSRETIKIPLGFVGYVMPKTSLCNEGILVFNTGLVDPGYEGRISTVAINFSRTPIPLDIGQVFLRFVLHKLEGNGNDERDRTAPGPADSALARRSVNYPPTFLDVPGQTDRLVREVTTDVVDRQRNAILLVISTVGFLFVLWNFGSYFLLSRQANTIAERSAQSQVKAMDFAKLRLEVDSLQANVRQFREALSKRERIR